MSVREGIDRMMLEAVVLPQGTTMAIEEVVMNWAFRN